MSERPLPEGVDTEMRSFEMPNREGEGVNAELESFVPHLKDQDQGRVQSAEVAHEMAMVEDQYRSRAKSRLEAAQALQLPEENVTAIQESEEKALQTATELKENRYGRAAQDVQTSLFRAIQNGASRRRYLLTEEGAQGTDMRQLYDMLRDSIRYQIENAQPVEDGSPLSKYKIQNGLKVRLERELTSQGYVDEINLKVEFDPTSSVPTVFEEYETTKEVSRW